jgi:hypothetical protein
VGMRTVERHMMGQGARPGVDYQIISPECLTAGSFPGESIAKWSSRTSEV